MKKLIIYTLCTCFTWSALNAQDKKREKIKAIKVAYITEKLQLSSSEAQKFWPVYNTYEEKIRNYRYQKIKIIKHPLKHRDIDTLSDIDAKKLLNEIAHIEERLHKEQQQFVETLMTIIPAKKIILLKKTEDEFNRRLLNRLKAQRAARTSNN